MLLERRLFVTKGKFVTFNSNFVSSQLVATFASIWLLEACSVSAFSRLATIK